MGLQGDWLGGFQPKTRTWILFIDKIRIYEGLNHQFKPLGYGMRMGPPKNGAGCVVFSHTGLHGFDWSGGAHIRKKWNGRWTLLNCLQVHCNLEVVPPPPHPSVTPPHPTPQSLHLTTRRHEGSGWQVLQMICAGAGFMHGPHGAACSQSKSRKRGVDWEVTQNFIPGLTSSLTVA